MTGLIRYAVGDLIDSQYEVREFLGSGANGDVYRVFDTYLEVECALKLLDPMPGVGDWKEAQSLQALHSDYILEVRTAAIIPGVDVRYITTAVAEGGDCRAATPARGVSAHQALRWCQQASNGLARVHDERLLHRDIKPANIFLRSDGRALLGDFGMAAAMDTADSADADGTPVTAAPELWSGGRCTVASDIYSMAASAFFLLTGEWPRPGKDNAEVKANAVAGIGPSLGDLAPHLPLRLIRTVDRGLSLDAAARHPTAAELAADLGVCGRELRRGWQRTDDHPSHHACFTGEPYKGRSAIQVCVVPVGRRFAVEAFKRPSGLRVHDMTRDPKPLAATLSAVRAMIRAY